MLQSAVRSDQRIAIYWPESYLLVLFIIIVKAGVVPTKRMKRHESDKAIQRKKESKESDRRRKRKNKSQILSVVSCVGALSVEMRTRNCSQSITL